MIELIEGDWKPHIAVTIDGTMNDIWVDYAVKSDVLIQYKKKGNREILYLKDPFGNYVEVVREK